MPREGIDYPGWFNRAACSIRCELSKLWSAVGSKVAKLNTVEPDGDGKVNIVSDSATLTVTDDPGSNAVRLELDAGLSSPPVQSVNGQTGAVVLQATDVSGPASIYNGSSLLPTSGTVANLITLTSTGARNGDNALRTRMTAAETAISAEASARQSADNALAAQIATKASTGDTVVKNPNAAQTIYGYDLGIDENLDVNGDADVGGDLNVTGSAAISALTVSGAATFNGTTSVPDTVAETQNLQAVNGNRLQADLNAYSPMMRLSNNQNYTGMKTYVKNAGYANIDTKIADYDGSAQATIWLGGTVDSNNGWLTLENIGAEGDGRAYYNKSIALKTANHYASVNIRLWLDDVGNMTIGILNPITGTWKTVVLQ